MPTIEDRPSYDEDMMSIALASITQRQKRKPDIYIRAKKKKLHGRNMVDHRGAPKLPGIETISGETIYKGAVAPQRKKLITTGTMIPTLKCEPP